MYIMLYVLAEGVGCYVHGCFIAGYCDVEVMLVALCLAACLMKMLLGSKVCCTPDSIGSCRSGFFRTLLSKGLQPDNLLGSSVMRCMTQSDRIMAPIQVCL